MKTIQKITLLVLLHSCAILFLVVIPFHHHEDHDEHNACMICDIAKNASAPVAIVILPVIITILVLLILKQYVIHDHYFCPHYHSRAPPGKKRVS